MAAWRAIIGSISVIITLAPKARKACAQPFPTSPYPATMATFPANMTSVALLIPSTSDSLQPYKLSNLLCKYTSQNAKGLNTMNRQVPIKPENVSLGMIFIHYHKVKQLAKLSDLRKLL